MSSLRHVDFNISGDDSRPVRVWGELVEAEIHTCTRHRGSVRIVRAIRCLRHVLVSRVVKVNTHVSSCWTVYRNCCIEMVQGVELVSGETASVEYASDERRPPLMD